MSDTDLVIAVDAMGGDDAPQVILDGVADALAEDESISVILCGAADVVEPFAAEHERCEAQVCSEVIGMDEHPAQAVRQKKDASVVVGCRLVDEGRAQGFFSAGSTGAVLTAATLKMGRIKGIARPGLATIVPSPTSPVVMCDVGANADCKPEYLVQFGQMATVYAEKIIGIDSPKAALLNIGSEETKGSKFAQEAYQLLSEQLDNFVGNAEGDDVLAANYDVIIADGFTGNVCLKTIEGTSKVLFKSLKGIMKKNLLTKLGAATMKGGLMDLMQLVNSETYGGAPLLGVKGACIKGHGSSSRLAVKNGVLIAARVVRERVPEIIEQMAASSPSRDAAAAER